MAKKKVELKFLKSAIPVGYAYSKADIAKFDAETAKSLMQDGFAIPADADDVDPKKEVLTLEDVKHSTDVNADDAIQLIDTIESFEVLKTFTHGETRKTVQESATVKAEELNK